MKKVRKHLLVLVGLPASGKSTYRIKNASKEAFHYSTDDLIDQEAARMNATYSEVFQDYVKQAHAIANQDLVYAKDDGKDVVWDQTNLNAKKRRTILNKFGNDYTKHCICILPPFNQEQEDELARRLDSRVGKDIPNFVMRSMRNSFELPTQNEGFNKVLYFDIYGNQIDRNVAADLFGTL